MQSNSPRQPSFALFATSVGMLAFGFVMLLFCLAYARDISTLFNAPFVVWNALCGIPSADPLTMPILLMLSVLSLMAGVILLVLHRARS